MPYRHTIAVGTRLGTSASNLCRDGAQFLTKEQGVVAVGTRLGTSASNLCRDCAQFLKKGKSL